MKESRLKVSRIFVEIDDTNDGKVLRMPGKVVEKEDFTDEMAIAMLKKNPRNAKWIHTHGLDLEGKKPEAKPRGRKPKTEKVKAEKPKEVADQEAKESTQETEK
jgi:hypothetical protein